MPSGVLLPNAVQTLLQAPALDMQELQRRFGGEHRDLWRAVSEHLAATADTSYIWFGLGCDECGAFPIVGRRYKCVHRCLLACLLVEDLVLMLVGPHDAFYSIVCYILWFTFVLGHCMWLHSL